MKNKKKLQAFKKKIDAIFDYYFICDQYILAQLFKKIIFLLLNPLKNKFLLKITTKSF